MEQGGATGSTTTTTPTTTATSTAAPVGGDSKGQPSTAKAVETAIRELGDSDMDALVTVQVNGQAQKIPLRDAVKRAQLEQASQAKMREAAQVRQQAMQLIEMANKNPREIFRMTGKNPVEFAEGILAEYLQEQQMSPEQKELRDLRAEKDRRATEEKGRQDQERKAQFQRTVQEQQSKYNQEFVKAWESTGLPPDPLFGQWLASEMIAAQHRGEKLTWNEASVKLVGKVEQFFPRILEAMETERFTKVLGQKNINRIREHLISSATQRAPTVNSGPQRPGVTSQKKPPVTQGQKRSRNESSAESEWDKWMKARLGR